MKIARISLTGADDATPLQDIEDLSRAHPRVEWGILLSDKRAGSERYPSSDFLQRLKTLRETTNLNLAAHLCGQTMRSFIHDIQTGSQDWLSPHGLTSDTFNTTFKRAQINFNAARENFTKETLQGMLRGWYETMDGCLITQHNSANTSVWEWLQEVEWDDMTSLKSHHILHDASGGNGTYKPEWNAPLAGVLNGYAGGLTPDNVVETLINNESIVGDGVIWIDMEGGLRTQGHFDLKKCRDVLERVELAAQERGWFFG